MLSLYAVHRLMFAPASPVDTGEDVHHPKRLRAYFTSQTMDRALFIPIAVLCNDVGLMVSPNNYDYQA